MDGAVDALAQRARAGTLARLGIMGGTFDPPHLGHLACAEEALEAFGLDAVLFVPTGRPAFKQDRPVTPGKVRLAMVAAAVAGNPAFAVSSPGGGAPRHHLRCGHVARAARGAAGGGARLHRSAPTRPSRCRGGTRAPSWAASRCSRPATRPGFELGEEALRVLRERRFDVRPFVVPGIDISSSELRQRVAEGRTIRYLVPEAVREIIEEEQLYRKEADHG